MAHQARRTTRSPAPLRHHHRPRRVRHDVSRSGFTRPAIEFAEANGIGLYQLSIDGNVTPVLELTVNFVESAGAKAQREAEDPAVKKLDQRIGSMASLSARVTDTIQQRSRHKLTRRERRSLEKARRLVLSTQSDISATNHLYERGKWKAATRKVDRITRVLTEAESELRP